MDTTGAPRPPLELRNATRMLGRMTWWDRHLGDPVFSGDLTLAVGTGEAWQGELSISACDAADAAMVGRRPLGGLTDDQLRQAARVAFGFDAEFYGLEVAWDTARFEVVQDFVITVAADVRWGELLNANVRRATVRVELVDREATYVEWVLSDGDNIAILETEELDVTEHASPSIDSMTYFCRGSLAAGLSKRGLPPPAFWHMHYDEMPAPDGSGSCGELRVWTLFDQP